MAPRVAHHGNLSREYREHAEQTGFHRLLYHLGTRDPWPRKRIVTDDAGDQSLHLLMELARELRAGDGGLGRAKVAGPCAANSPSDAPQVCDRGRSFTDRQSACRACSVPLWLDPKSFVCRGDQGAILRAPCSSALQRASKVRMADYSCEDNGCLSMRAVAFWCTTSCPS